MLATGPGAPASLEFRGRAGGARYVFTRGHVVAVHNPRDAQVIDMSHIKQGKLVEVTRDGQLLRLLPHRGSTDLAAKGPASFMRMGKNKQQEMPAELKEELLSEQEGLSVPGRSSARVSSVTDGSEEKAEGGGAALSSLARAIRSKKSQDTEKVREVPPPTTDPKSIDTSRVKPKSSRSRKRHGASSDED